MLVATALLLAACRSPAADTERRYEFYEPQVRHVTIHEGKLAPGHNPYNHMASVEWFDGRFHCVWGGHAETHLEGKPGQLNLWATSADFTSWGAPQPFAHTGPGALARDPQCVQWQPNLLNFQDRQLWCVWSFNSKVPDLDGLWLSTLDKGRLDWKHRRIQRRQNVGNLACSIFASQNPVLLTSGRVLAPVTLNHRDPKHDAGGSHATNNVTLRWNACFFTDDGGTTWQCSDPISNVEDATAQWEPFFYEQSDGRIRAFMRNFTKGTPPGNMWRLTTVGTGAAIGSPLRFPDDPVYSFMETANCRPQVFRTDGGRYCLLQQDAFVNHRDYSTRLNVALHFSRSGADDFVAGPPVSRPGVISAYPQGVEHDGAIYLAYSAGPGNEPRSIEGAIVTPAPKGDRHYIWPRSKELVTMQDQKDADGKKKVVRINPDARTALPRVKTVDGRRTIQFSARASAGVDIDPVDFAAGDSLEFSFRAKVLRLQPIGRLVLCSLGDRIPLRLGMPANRPENLYAYSRDQWEPVGDFTTNAWHEVRLIVRGGDFTVAVDGRQPRTFANPIANPAPRLYLGDGFELDYIYSLTGSEFLIDLGSIRSRVSRGTILPAGWDPKAAADRVLQGLVPVTAPQVKGAHDAEMALVGDRAYIVAEVNDVRPGEGAGWPEIYAAMSIVNLTTKAVERVIPFARGGQAFDNVALPEGSCFVPRILAKDDRTLRCFFAMEHPGKGEAQTWYLDYDIAAGTFEKALHKARLKTTAGTFDLQPGPFHADSAAKGFRRPAKDFGLYLFDSFKQFDGRTYVAMNNFPVGQNALAIVHDDLTTFEVLGHYNEPQSAQLSESAVNRLPDGTWMAICRNDKGNYHFTTSPDGRTWTEGREMPFVANGANSKPTFDRIGGVYWLGWQDAARVGGVGRSVFNVDVSRDGRTWERKYRFETEKSFQYPTFREHRGGVYVAVTQGDSSPSRKERIMFGKVEDLATP